MAKTILQKTDKAKGLQVLNVNLTIKLQLSRLWYWYTDRHIGQQNRAESPEINLCTHGQVMCVCMYLFILTLTPGYFFIDFQMEFPHGPDQGQGSNYTKVRALTWIEPTTLRSTGWCCSCWAKLARAQIIFDKGAKANEEKDSYFNSWSWKNWIGTGTRVKLDCYLTPYTKLTQKYWRTK